MDLDLDSNPITIPWMGLDLDLVSVSRLIPLMLLLYDEMKEI